MAQLRIVCISDTHSLHRKAPTIPDGDVLIHAGDLTNTGKLHEVAQFNAWIGELPHQHKIVIAGNHDFCFEQEAEEAESLLTHATYLRDSAHEIDGVKFYGSPWTPWFLDWAFNFPKKERGSGELATRTWAAIPDDVNVLITHGPPCGLLDRVDDRPENVGCPFLMQRIKALPRLRLHVFGHIHEGYGGIDKDGVVYVNASICNLRYRPINEPVVFELGDEDETR